MADWTVTLDPAAVSTRRTALSLSGSGLLIRQEGIDWGDAAITAFLADLKYGSVPVDFRIPNRVVTIPLGLGMDQTAGHGEAQRRLLAEKVALLHREGGTLLRQRQQVGALAMYADVVDASLHIPDRWGENSGGVEDEIVLVLTCLPDFYGDEVTCDAVSGTQYVDQVLQIAGAAAQIGGDYPARARIRITDTSGHDQKGYYWALRSRYYDSATTAALVYNANSLSLNNGSTLVVQAGTVGGKVVQNTFIGTGGFIPTLSLMNLTHKGSYRVLCRVQGIATPTQLQLIWQEGTITGIPESNDPVTIPGDATVGESGTNYYMVDLGEVRLDVPPMSGTWRWQLAVQAMTTAGQVTVNIDAIYLLPLDDGSGRVNVVSATPANGGGSAQASSKSPGNEFNDATVGTETWTISSVPGDRADIYSNTTGASPVTTKYYKATNWGLNVPATATILGVQVGVKRRASASALVFGTWDNLVRLVVNGAIVTPGRSQSASWPGSYQWKYYGGPTDLWGQTAASLAPGAVGGVNANNFGFVISAKFNPPPTAGFAPSILGIAAVSMTVYFQLPNGLVVANDAVIYANKIGELRTEGAYRQDASGVYPAPVASVQGDLPRIPPSGAEGRVCEVFVDTSRGNLDTDPDTNLDALTVQVFYRPCYIERP